MIIQGFGNVGSNAARLMHEAGYKIIGIAEYDGGLYNHNGIDIDALWEHAIATARIHGFKGAEAYDSARTDRSPIATSSFPRPPKTSSPRKNADQDQSPDHRRRRQRPTTAVADEILADKQIFVVPDILANAGGVTASYFEWVQDRQGYFWKEVRRQRAARAHPARSFEDVVRTQRRTT